MDIPMGHHQVRDGARAKETMPHDTTTDSRKLSSEPSWDVYSEAATAAELLQLA